MSLYCPDKRARCAAIYMACIMFEYIYIKHYNIIISTNANDEMPAITIYYNIEV
jgi:hypothetical protein